MEENYKKGQEMDINGYKMNYLCFRILKALVRGEGIRTNENMLAQKLNVHRKTIERRISNLLTEKIISKPACRFPKFFVPPGQILVYCLAEIKKFKDKILKAIKTDPFVPLALEISIGRYNLLMFKVFFNVEGQYLWEERYDNRFPGCFGAMKKISLSPQMTASINQQKVSLSIIRRRKEFVRGKGLMESVERNI